MTDKEPEQLSLMRRLVELAVEQTALSVERTAQSAERSRMSLERSEMSAERSYMNAERTLSVWVRTALGLMICGLAVDRFGLFVVELPVGPGDAAHHSNVVSNWVGVALVALGVAMAVVTGWRFYAYAVAYRRQHRLPLRHGPFLAPFFALMVAVFGIAVLVVMVAVAW